MIDEIRRMTDILSSFLGEPKDGYDGMSYQLQFSCPRCIENEGNCERNKFNLEINLQKSVYNCWKCSSSGDYEMSGKLGKLFRLYGNDALWSEYKMCLKSIRDSELYRIDFSEDDFNSLDNDDEVESLPISFKKFDKKFPNGCKKGLDYLFKRNIKWDLIEKYGIGYIKWDEENPNLSNRIIIPSFDEFENINYWVGRDYTGKSKMKYMNSKNEKKNIIFNERFIRWDADITLCEGPFDALAIDLNCIPLLGKSINKDFKLYSELFDNAAANINIFLDGDAKSTAKFIYDKLNQGRLRGKIRYIPVEKEYDPSDIFQRWGKKGIAEYLKRSVKLKDSILI